MADIYFYKSITGQVYNFRDSRVDSMSGALPATEAPLMDGTAAVGTSIKYAREDHVHPADTNKVDKEADKGLSTNDFTTAEKNKLAGIAAGAEVNVQSDWNVTNTSSDAYIKNKPTIPTETSQLTNDSNFVSDANYVHTDNNFTTALKNKLNGIASGAEVNVQSDWDQTDTAADDYIKNKPSLLALGETSTTAYRGDRGKTAYTHATDSSRLTTATASGLYKVASTAQGHIASLTAVTKADITALGIPSQDTTYSAGAGLSLSGTTFAADVTGVKGNQNTSYKTGNVNLTASDIGSFRWDGIGVALASGDNVDSGLTNGVTYYSASSTVSAALAGTPPTTGSGFKIFQGCTYGTGRQYQIALGNEVYPFVRFRTSASGTWGGWRMLASISANTAVGSATNPVYATNKGVLTACNYTLGKSVPSNAVFTDTTYSAGTGLSLSDNIFSANEATRDSVGIVNTSAQTFGGEKTFYNNIALYGTGGGSRGTLLFRNSNAADIGRIWIDASGGGDTYNRLIVRMYSINSGTFEPLTTYEEYQLPRINVDRTNNATFTIITSKDGVEHLTGYGECSTAGSTAAKTVTVANLLSLKAGVTIHVKFTNTNTATSPTLNVNSLGAKAISQNGAVAAGTTEATSWKNNAVVTLTYDGTRWLINR